MKITPLELRQFEFEKTFRGYSIEEVDMFINNLAQEWERVLTETKMMRMQLELAEKEAAKLREIELTLFKTLKTAEDTSTMITEQANQQAAKNLSEASIKANKQVADAQMEADKYLAEAKIEAEKVLSDARLKANDTLQQADEKAKYVKEDVLSDVKAIENDFNALVNYKEQLLTQMRGFATATVEHVERFEGKFDIEAIETKIQKANELVAAPVSFEESSGADEAQEDVVNELLENEESKEETTSDVDNEEVIATADEELAEEKQEDAKEEEVEVDFVENLDEETITAETTEEDITEEVVEEDTSENENEKDAEETLEQELEDDNVVVQTEIAKLDDELVENYEDEEGEKIVESYEESDANKTNSDVIEDEKEKEDEPDFSVVNSIKESIVSKTVIQHKDSQEEEETISVIPSSVNKLATEDVEYTAASGDDLTRIEGIGPKVQDILKDVGILTFRDVATTPLYKIKEHLQNAGPNYNMIDASTWTEQALLAAEGRWDELEARQEELIGGREPEPEPEKKPEPVVDKAVVEQKNVQAPAVSEKDVMVETVAAAPADKVLESNLENITEEMLEKVNKVKSAIRKAMSEKSEKPDAEKEKGNLPTLDDVLKRNRSKSSGSFFDNID